LSFNIFGRYNIKTFVIFLNVAEVFTLVNEDLPPVGIGAPYSHLLSSSVTIDVPGLVVVSGSDCQ